MDETVVTDVQKKLRKLRKEKEKDEFIVKKYGFYAGQRFASSKAIKDKVYIHSIETRRKLKLVRNDKVRVRAKCEGPIPVFDLNNGPLNDGLMTLDLYIFYIALFVSFYMIYKDF